MAFRYNDRVRVNVVPSGTGDIPLGTTPIGYLSFDDGGFIDADTTIACIIVPATGEFEVCPITYNSGVPSITRGTPIESSNAGATVSFTAGTAGVVFVGLSATKVVHVDMTESEFMSSGVSPYRSIGVLTATGTVQGDAATITSRRTFITAGAADTGVILRAAANDPTGSFITVTNKTASDKIVYPDSGSNFDSDAANTGIVLSPGQTMNISRQGATQWYTH